MASRAGDWFRQAERDLEQAADCRTAGRHEWACFAAHQAAEKAEYYGPLQSEEALRFADRGRPSPVGAGAGAPFERRAADWDLTGLPVPTDTLVYTEDEWRRLDPASRFARVLARELVWVYEGSRG